MNPTTESSPAGLVVRLTLQEADVWAVAGAIVDVHACPTSTRDPGCRSTQGIYPLAIQNELVVHWVNSSDDKGETVRESPVGTEEARIGGAIGRQLQHITQNVAVRSMGFVGPHTRQLQLAPNAECYLLRGLEVSDEVLRLPGLEPSVVRSTTPVQRLQANDANTKTVT